MALNAPPRWPGRPGSLCVLGQLPHALLELDLSLGEPVEGRDSVYGWLKAKRACLGKCHWPQELPAPPYSDTGQSLVGGLGKKCGPLPKAPRGILG